MLRLKPAGNFSLFPYSLIPLFFSFPFFIFSCTDEHPVRLEGFAQGTTFNIIYLDAKNREFSSQVDSILITINRSLSTYDSASIISRINRNEPDVVTDTFFEDVFRKSAEVSERTGGAFDVTVAPLVNAWGFGPSGTTNADSATVDSLKKLISYRAVRIENHRLIKNDPRITVDFNAIAQGYTVDVLCTFLDQQGIENYFVELGGEVRVKGTPGPGKKWRVGIDKPTDEVEEERPLQAVIELENKALATSGNYRKFYVKDGIKYSHTIDPATGYPVNHSLLSATVVARDCMTADAYATAFMVMGADKAIEYLKMDTTLQAYLVYSGEKGEWKTYGTKTLLPFMKNSELSKFE